MYIQRELASCNDQLLKFTKTATGTQRLNFIQFFLSSLHRSTSGRINKLKATFYVLFHCIELRVRNAKCFRFLLTSYFDIINFTRDILYLYFRCTYGSFIMIIFVLYVICETCVFDFRTFNLVFVVFNRKLKWFQQ